MKTQKQIKEWSSRRGVALAVAFMVVGALVTLSSGFVASTVTELNTAKHYKNSTKSFWAASSGINEFINNTSYIGTATQQTVSIGGVPVVITKTDTSSQRSVTAVANIGGSRRGIEIVYPANPPGLFENTMTSGGNFNLTGLLAQLDVYGKTRIGGTYTKSGFLASAYFEDKISSLGTTSTTLKYPDTTADVNTTPDEFADFVRYYQDQCSALPAAQVQHIVVGSGDSVIIYPNRSNAGKRIIFVQGPSAGTGDVDLLFDASWRASENLTIVSTGTVSYIQPLQLGVDSKLNVVSWNDYNEASVLYSAHQGVTFAHDNANFYSVLNYSVTSGNVIANQNINAMEALTWKRFNYDDPVDENGNVPPGFSGLIAQSGSGYVAMPTSWKEI